MYWKNKKKVKAIYSGIDYKEANFQFCIVINFSPVVLKEFSAQQSFEEIILFF